MSEYEKTVDAWRAVSDPAKTFNVFLVEARHFAHFRVGEIAKCSSFMGAAYLMLPQHHEHTQVQCV
jgi:hypothetical protein